MNWHEQINEAFDYIEDHLDGTIDIDKVANIMCQSTVSFQRTFSIFMNISIYDYIRRRRMTLAAIELQTTTIKVIDLALKHGYESPESFTRTFKEIHGITPSTARKKDVTLNLFPRITFLLTVKGDIEIFDCIFAYHVISHTDSIGLKKTISEIERVLKPNGEVYLSFCSKESTEFIENRSNKFDKNTIVCRDGLEKGIPHFFADLNDIKELLVNFKIELVKHTEYFYGDLTPISNQRQKFYYVNAILK